MIRFSCLNKDRFKKVRKRRFPNLVGFFHRKINYGFSCLGDGDRLAGYFSQMSKGNFYSFR